MTAAPGGRGLRDLYMEGEREKGVTILCFVCLCVCEWVGRGAVFGLVCVCRRPSIYVGPRARLDFWLTIGRLDIIICYDI